MGVVNCVEGFACQAQAGGGAEVVVFPKGVEDCKDEFRWDGGHACRALAGRNYCLG